MQNLDSLVLTKEEFKTYQKRRLFLTAYYALQKYTKKVQSTVKAYLSKKAEVIRLKNHIDSLERDQFALKWEVYRLGQKIKVLEKSADKSIYEEQNM